jgi:hypothetical protein
MARMALLSLAALALLAAPAGAAKRHSCGSYPKGDGSPAAGIVTRISVTGASCGAAQRVAGDYSGITGKFRSGAYGCVGVQPTYPAGMLGSVRCAKRGVKLSYRTAPMTDCSMTPGMLVPPLTGTPILGPWSYNTDCATAVNIANAATGASGSLPPDWACGDNTASSFDPSETSGYCHAPSGTTYDVVQWANFQLHHTP